MFCPEAKEGQRYKYRIWGPDRKARDHADPYGFGMEVRPASCSVIRDLGTYRFNDQKWMEGRTVCTDRALNIYEMHIGSWKKPSQEEAEKRLKKLWLSSRFSFASSLIEPMLTGSLLKQNRHRLLF